MSKYNQYAQHLDTAFKMAREEYMNAWNKLQAAQKANTDAQAWRAETYRGENDLRRQRARAQLLEAEHTFRQRAACGRSLTGRKRQSGANLKAMCGPAPPLTLTPSMPTPWNC